MSSRSRSEERKRLERIAAKRSTRASRRPQDSDDEMLSGESTPPPPRRREALAPEVPPEFAWLGNLITVQSNSVKDEIEEQFKYTNKKVQKVRAKLGEVSDKVDEHDTTIKEIQKTHQSFVEEYYRSKVASELEMKLLKEELASVKRGEGRPLGSAMSTAAGSDGQPSASNNVYGRCLIDYFILGNLGGIESELAEAWIKEESAKAGLAVDDIQCAKPICSWAFVKFRGMMGKSPRDAGYLWKKWLDTHPTWPLSPVSGKPKTEGEVGEGEKLLWTNIHREKDERDRRSEINAPKAYLHDFRKAHGIGETYAVRTSNLRIISGNLMAGSEDVKWKGQTVATFRTEEGSRIAVWRDQATLDRILGGEATNTDHPWNYAQFLSNYVEFVRRRVAARS